MAWPRRVGKNYGTSPANPMKRQLSALLLLTGTATLIGPAWAQTRIQKLHSICPFGYVDSFNGYCVSPINYRVEPTHGQPCKPGWMNIGGGYCKKKEFGIF